MIISLLHNYELSNDAFQSLTISLIKKCFSVLNRRKKTKKKNGRKMKIHKYRLWSTHVDLNIIIRYFTVIYGLENMLAKSGLRKAEWSIESCLKLNAQLKNIVFIIDIFSWFRWKSQNDIRGNDYKNKRITSYSVRYAPGRVWFSTCKMVCS